MPVSVQQWRVEIGTFSCRYILRYPQNCNFFLLYFADAWGH